MDLSGFLQDFSGFFRDYFFFGIFHKFLVNGFFRIVIKIHRNLSRWIFRDFFRIFPDF